MAAGPIPSCGVLVTTGCARCGDVRKADPLLDAERLVADPGQVKVGVVLTRRALSTEGGNLVVGPVDGSTNAVPEQGRSRENP